MGARFLALAVVAVVGASQPAASATDLFWYFQRTGYTTSTSAQTAVAMGDSKSWPVVFSLASGSTQAYSLTPVRNGTTNTYWNQIGTNIINGSGMLSADSSNDGRVGVSIASSPPYYYGPVGTAAVGRRTTGFATTFSNVQGITFDQSGSIITASVDTLAGSGITSSSLPTVQSIASSPFGGIGVLTGSNGWLFYYEKNPLTGWGSAAVTTTGTVFGGDLAIDTSGRPFVAYSTAVNGGWGVAASYFDIMSGQWRSSTFNTPSMNSVVMPTIAADGIGGIGVAWMGTNQSTGVSSLMYAYKNGVKDWSLYTVTSGSVSTFSALSGTATSALLPQQRVGLDFDAQNWPVISFLGNSGYGSPADIWIAYDPVVVPEPSSLMLAALGLLAAGFARRRTRC